MGTLDIFNVRKYNAVVCAIAKNEHLYINEWVGHYIKLGFDKIFIFDNDEKDSKYIGDCIDSKYMSKVKIFDKRGVHKNKFQHKCYQEFYDKYNESFNWCLFCDVDEFLDGVGNIKKFLKTIPKSIGQIRVKWRLFGDDNLIERDVTKPVYNFFKEVKGGVLQNQGKFILRGGLKDVIIVSSHFASILERNNLVPSCLPSGKRCNDKIDITTNYSNEKIYLNHYMTKTLSEFVNQKVNRGDAVFGSRTINLDYFWNLNEKTQEKLDWLNERGFI